MNALYSPFSSSLLNSIKSVNVTGKTIPTTNLVMTEYIFEYRTSFRASFSAERGDQLKITNKHTSNKVIKSTGLRFSLKTFHSKEHVFIEACCVSTSSWTWTLFLASKVKRRMTNPTLVTKITLSTIWKRNSREEQVYHQIIAEPVNPRNNATETLSLEHNSEAPCAVGWSNKCSKSPLSCRPGKIAWNLIELLRHYRILWVQFPNLSTTIQHLPRE